MALKKIFPLLILILICIGNLYSQGFNSVYSPDGNKVIAVGNNGNVYRSTDGGATFYSAPVGVVNLNSVVYTGSKIIIAANSGLIYYSSDNGTTWSNQTLSAQNLNSVSFSSANTGWVVGDNGTIFKTVNGGLNWTQQTSSTSSNLHGVKATLLLTGACGDNGTAIATSNGGTSWVPFPTGVTNNLLSIDAGVSTVIATSADGFILKFDGANLSNIDYNIVTKSEVRSISMLDDNNFYSAGGGGFIRKSTDGGTSFTFQKNPMMGKLSSIYFYNSSKGWACASSNNAIIRTTDGGNTWSLPTGTTIQYAWSLKQSNNNNIGNGMCLNPLNKNVLYVAMGNLVYRSNNLGDNWTQVSTISQGLEAHTFIISPQDTNVWLASMDDAAGKVMKTTNHGSTWVSVWTGTLTSYGMPLEIDQNNPSVCYLAPDNAVMLRSTNFGSNWSTWGTKIFRSPCDIAVEFGNSNIMWVADGTTGSGSGDFWKSTNNGVNWSQVHTVTGSEVPMIATTSLDPALVYHTTWASGGFWKSTDQGGSFVLTSGSSGNLWAADIAKDDPNTVLYGTYGSSGFLSTDGGNTFINQNMGGSWGAGIYCYDKATLLFQQGTGVYKLAVTYTVPLVTGNNQISSEIPKDFSLLQNYPNPFNPSTQIKYSVPAASQVKITVYDISGRIVETLVNRTLQAGTYSAAFDGSNLSSGVYFYKIEAGSFIATKKMALIK